MGDVAPAAFGLGMGDLQEGLGLEAGVRDALRRLQCPGEVALTGLKPRDLGLDLGLEILVAMGGDRRQRIRDVAQFDLALAMARKAWSFRRRRCR